MPQARMLTKQALYTVSQLHGELAGKLSATCGRPSGYGWREATRKQANNLQAAVLRARKGGAVVAEGFPWRLWV